MKKFWTLTLILLAGFTIQSTFAQGIGVGLKGGVNLNKLSVDNISNDVSSYTGWHVGAYVILGFSEKWALQPEVLYEARGTKFDGTQLNDQIEKLNYLSIPLLLRWKPIGVLSLHAGPQVGFLTGAEIPFDIGNTPAEDIFTSVDWSIAVGGTVHLPLGLNAGVRYNYGLTNIANDPDFPDEEKKTRTFQIFVGWTIFGAK